jgi:CubicO group peptidase (beta-lactamase class C family)
MFQSGFLSLVVVLLYVGLASAQPSNTEIAVKADEYMNALLKVKGIGGSILLAKDGSILLAKGYGQADRDANVPNSATTKHRIGSLTKQFTAAGILLLQEQGKLLVTDRACKYLADCPDTWKSVTIHQLLSHTSGITSFTSLPDWRMRRMEDLTPADVLGLVRDLPLKTAPGDAFDYSNTNYTLLGLIIEKTSGKTYDVFLKEKIAEPLKLASTGYDHGRARLPNSALGYSKHGDDVVPAVKASMMPPYAAGGMYSTVNDLYEWQMALLGGKLLTEESVDAMLTPVKNNYGYGIAKVVPPTGRTRITHSGGIEGFSSNITIFPNEKAVVIVLLNNDGEMAQNAASALAAIMFGEDYAIPIERKTAAVDAKILDSYVGKYSVAPGLEFTIARKSDGLTFQPTGQPAPIDIFAESETKFFLKVVDAQITFIKDANGKVTGLEFQQGGRTTKAKRAD